MFRNSFSFKYSLPKCLINPDTFHYFIKKVFQCEFPFFSNLYTRSRYTFSVIIPEALSRFKHRGKSPFLLILPCLYFPSRFSWNATKITDWIKQRNDEEVRKRLLYKRLTFVSQMTLPRSRNYPRIRALTSTFLPLELISFYEPSDSPSRGCRWLVRFATSRKRRQTSVVSDRWYASSRKVACDSPPNLLLTLRTL